MNGVWFNRTKEYYARRKGLTVEKYDFATRYAINPQQLPAFVDDTPEAYRQMVADILGEIEEDAADKRKGRRVLGVDRILAQDPCQPMGKPKKSPVPALFKGKGPGVAEGMRNKYKDFVDDYNLASGKMLDAALQGYSLDPRRYFPDGSFPPSVIDQLIASAAGFNPEAEFPPHSFPRPWPFVGGELCSPPPDPPSRELVYQEIDGQKTIVWRGEIPTVCVPSERRSTVQARPRIGRARRLKNTACDGARSPPIAA
jgi:hypothetical protein